MGNFSRPGVVHATLTGHLLVPNDKLPSIYPFNVACVTNISGFSQPKKEFGENM